MTSFTALRSKDNPRIRALLRLRRHRARREEGRFIADGVRQCARAVEAGLALHAAFLCRDRVPTDEAPIVDRLVYASSPDRWFDLTPTLMAHVAYRQGPQSLLGVFDQPRWSAEATAASSATLGPALWLVAVGIAKPGNLGAMLRTADAAGARGVWVADAVVDPFHPNAIEASTGAVFALPVHTGTSVQVLDFMATGQVQVVAGMPAARTPHTQVDMTGPLAIVIGAEDRGLGPPWTAAVQGDPSAVKPVSIPTAGRVTDSLNASTSAAVLLFEAVRQRAVDGRTQDAGPGPGETEMIRHRAEEGGGGAVRRAGDGTPPRSSH